MRVCATGAIVLAGERSVVVQLNDVIYRFGPDERGRAAAEGFAAGIYDALLKLAAMEEGGAVDGSVW